MPVTRATASMIWRTESPLPLPSCTRQQRPALLESLGGGDVGDREVGDVDVVADTGTVRGWVVIPVDARHLARDETLEDQREEVVRTGVAQVLISRADHIEISQRGVTQRRRSRRRGASHVAKQPLADQLGFAVGDSGCVGSCSLTRSVPGVP